MDKIKKLKKLSLLDENPSLALFDELSAVNGKLLSIKENIKLINSKEAALYYDEIDKLNTSINSLEESLKNKDLVVNVDIDKIVDSLNGVLQAIKSIKIDIPKQLDTLKVNEGQINDLLFAINSIPEFPIDKLEVFINILGKKIESIKIDIPEQEKFDYLLLDKKFNELIKAVKNISISVSSGGSGLGTQTFQVAMNNIYSGYKDKNGVDHGYIDNSGSPQICAQPYLQALAEGDIAGHSTWVKFGYNGALSNVSEDIWSVGGVYVWPATAQQMEVVSSSANDTSAGTGVQTVRIYYLDASFNEKTTDVTLNGTTPVATTATDIYRINYFVTLTAGTGGAAAGNIDVRNLSDTPIYARILAGQNANRDFVYTVPVGKTLYITNVLLSAGSNVAGRPVTFTTRATYDRYSKSLRTFFFGYTELIVQDQAIDLALEMPTMFPAGTDLKISAVSPDGATYGAVTVRGWIE